MRSPASEISALPDTTQSPLPKPRSRKPIRFALFVLHIAILVTLTSMVPHGYAFEVGESAGAILLFGCPAIWLFLFLARERWQILLFCILAFAQTGFVGLVVLQLRAEDRVFQSIAKEVAMERSEGASQMQQFRMDSLFEMTSGKRQLSIAELRELQIRARSGKEKWLELHAHHIRLLSDAERRIAATSSKAADNFRLGVESARPSSDEEMKVMQDYFTEIEQLTGFLINRQGQYLQTSNGVVFKTEKDSHAFNKQLDAIAKQLEAIAQLEKKLASSDPGLAQH